MPCPASGSETAAPSGMFWMPMPSASASAEESSAGSPERAAEPATRPNEPPSGTLCSVIAMKSSIARCIEVFGPSGRAAPGCRCGSAVSRSFRKSAPAATPEPAASHGVPPCACAISCAGMIRLQTDAAIMMPAAKPSESVSASSAPRPRPFPGFMKKTAAAPAAVQRKVKPVARVVWASALRSSDVMGFRIELSENDSQV